MGEALQTVAALVATALVALLLISDWGTERANVRVRRIRRIVIAALVVFLLHFIYTIARYGWSLF